MDQARRPLLPSRLCGGRRCSALIFEPSLGCLRVRTRAPGSQNLAPGVLALHFSLPEVRARLRPATARVRAAVTGAVARELFRMLFSLARPPAFGIPGPGIRSSRRESSRGSWFGPSELGPPGPSGLCWPLIMWPVAVRGARADLQRPCLLLPRGLGACPPPWVLPASRCPPPRLFAVPSLRSLIRDVALGVLGRRPECVSRTSSAVGRFPGSNSC